MTSKRTKWRFWRVARICFRWSRITIWLVFLSILLALAYLHFTGLPDFAQTMVRKSLLERGIRIEFTTLRLAYKGLIASDLRLSGTEPKSPVFTSPETEVHLHVRQLLKKQFALDFLKIQNGSLEFGPASANAPRLIVHKVQAEIHFPRTNEIQLHEFNAEFRGAKVIVTGNITNFQEIRNWPIFASTNGPKKKFDFEKLQQQLDKIQTSESPVLEAHLKGDARFPFELQGEVSLKVPSVKTPWGEMTGFEAVSSMHRPKDVQIQKFGDVDIKAKEALTPWGKATDLKLVIKYNPDRSLTNSVAADVLFQAASLDLESTNLSVPKIALKNLDVSGTLIQASTNPIPSQAKLKIKASSAVQGEQEVKNFETAFQFTREESQLDQGDPALGFWSKLVPYKGSWDLKFTSLTRTNLQLGKVLLSGNWNAPNLHIENLEASLYDGKIKASGSLNITSRTVELTTESKLDPKRIEHLLSASAQRWMSKYTWEKAPDLNGKLSLRLPLWTNTQPDWAAEVAPTLTLSGAFKVGMASYRKVDVLNANGSFSLSNQVWRLPDIQAARPEGNLSLGLVVDEVTKDFYFDVDSTLDPLIARIIIPSENEKAWQFAKFSKPPHIKARIWGSFEDGSRLGAEGTIDVTNITVRAIDYDRIVAQVRYTNMVIEVTEPRIHKGEDLAQAREIKVDLDKKTVAIVDGTTTIDPLIVTASISDHAFDAIKPYHFATVPKVLVNGWISMTRIESVDLTFDVEGENLKWLIFQVDAIKGQVHWLNEGLSLTNIVASGYKSGHFGGWALFDFRPKHGTDYQFSVAFNDMDVPAMVHSVKPDSAKKLDGLLDGLLVMTYANTSDTNVFQGYGRLNLRDGFIWEIPVFGVFSPVINAILPGFGKSKAKAAAGHFVITNSVASTDDLEIHASAVRLLYRGSVDLNQNLEASVEAELLRDTPLVGKIISLVFMPFSKLFEYTVTGTLSDPQLHAKYLPLPKKGGTKSKEDKSEEPKPEEIPAVADPPKQ
ncbi:MAG: hypothetical protein JWM04_2324 [Verrucomicrobiales bacterium]|nr:hypothetical protein [Verrucomicrobiales bacterium]